MSKVTIVEMGLRDGLQNEAVHLSVNQRYQLLRRMNDSGLRRIEIGSFVSPRWVPQMAATDQLVKRAYKGLASKQLDPKLRLSALVPNLRGLENALKADVKEVAVFGAASESFSRKNINRSIADSMRGFKEVVAEARRHKLKVRGYLSMVFACPYEGKIPEARVLRLIDQYMDLGIHEISLGDTIGVASPKQVRSLLKKLFKNHSSKKVAMHFHDTRGTAIANVLASLDMGCRIFDTSLGGLGGCPYAPGAAGNVATEDVIYMLHEMGLKTGVDLQKLINATLWMNKQVGRQLPSRLSLAGIQ